MRAYERRAASSTLRDQLLLDVICNASMTAIWDLDTLAQLPSEQLITSQGSFQLSAFG
jgi:hypothetical protein